MTYFPWSDKYSVGIRLIDNDHKVLVDIVNDLHDAVGVDEPHVAITFAITALAHYVKEHFDREEKILKQHGYPDLANHQKAHGHLRKIVHAIRKFHSAEPGRLDPEKVLGFLRYWLKQHICGEDMAYVPYLTGKDGGNLADPRNVVTADREGARRATPNQDAEPPASITIKVPRDKVEIIRRCAHLISEGGPEAQALEEIADPIIGMSLHEAEKLIERLLRESVSEVL